MVVLRPQDLQEQILRIRLKVQGVMLGLVDSIGWTEAILLVINLYLLLEYSDLTEHFLDVRGLLSLR